VRGNGQRVLIVGAGIAGLAAARAMRGWGASIDVIDRTPAPAAEGTGIYLPGNAVRALATLGLADEVTSHAVRIIRQRFADHRGHLLLDIDVADLWRGVGPCLAIHRADLHRVLLSGIEEIPVRWGQTPTAMAADRGGTTVEFRDGSTCWYDVVLGADGVHSTVRRLVFGGHGVRSLDQYARRFLVAQPDPEPVWSVLLGRASAFLTIPIGDGRVYCYCDSPPGSPPPDLRMVFNGYAEPVPTLLDALGSASDDGTTQAGVLEEVILDTWSRGTVLLIGDAAHATSPNMAQGAAMALEDAIIIAECLSAADSTADALAAYERRRRPRTDWVIAHTHRRDRTRALAPAIRNLVLRQFGRRIFHANYKLLFEQP
jgi:FAD-dependent urate hydroxylase